MNSDETAIAATLARYQDAVNASDADAALRLYTADAVFMPQNSPSSVGRDAVRAAYVAIFARITLSVTFEVVEVHQVGPQWAFARTNSSGQQIDRTSGVSEAEANQELFVFQKVGNDWKIARYCFSTTNPPRK
jgi:uncharacterized protein (TIGR02246 family)